ncbi:MAG: AsmA family protein [Pseudomonadales bacterium]|nr:AsmA family protein [Pseudomonadales bacterium]
MRRLLLVVAGLLFSLIAALLVALRSESFVLGAAHWAVAAFTDFRLELVAPRVDFYGGSLSAEEVHLVPQSGDGPALLSVLDLAAGLPAVGSPAGGPRRSYLHAGSILIYTSDNSEASQPEPMQWLGYLGWLPMELRIGQVHLVTSAANTWIFPLKNVRGDRLDSGNYQLTAEADYEGEPLQIAVDLLAVEDGWGATSAEAKVQLLAPVSASEITLAGTLEGTADDFRYDFALNAFYRDISGFLKGFEGGGDLAGELRMQGNMAGDTEGFVLSDATFLLNNIPDYAFQASGSLEYKWSGETRIELAALGEMASMSYLVNWIEFDVADFGRIQSEIKLSGSLDKPVIDEFRLTTSNDAGLQVSMSGQLNLFETDTENGPGTNAITIDLEGPSLAVLQRWIGEAPFEPGPWRAHAQLTGDQNNFSLQDIRLESGEPDSLELGASGSVGRISRPQAEQEQYTVDGILLSLKAHAPDSAQIGSLLARDDIPPDHEVTASVEISGSGQELLLNSGALTISGSELQATAGPLSAVLRPADPVPLSALAGPVRIELADTSALSQYTSPFTPQPIPALGALTVTAQLAQNGEVFQLRDLVGSVSGEGMEVATKGRIGNLVQFDDVSLDTSFTGLDNRMLLSLVRPDFDYDKPLGAMEGAFKLRRKQAVWTVPKLTANGGAPDAAFGFSLDGDIRDLTGLIGADIRSQFRIGDPALLETLTGLRLKPVSGDLTVAAADGQVSSKATALLGETRIDAIAHIAVGESGIQNLKLTVDTPHLHLQDFGLGLELDQAQKQATQQDQQAAPGAPATTEAAPGFVAQLRQSAPLFPIDISLKIDELSGDASNIDTLQLRITGNDRRYMLQEFSARYSDALAEVRGIIDLNPDPAALSLAGQATALPLSAILADAGVKTNVSGALSILGGVTVMGEDTQALIASLNGSVAIALENAVIEGAAYDLLATDLLAWIYSGALTEKSTHLDCTMAKFQLRQGVATTDSLYIESARMVATGTAEFDLPRQKMDLRITPLSKSRLLQVPSEVRLKGDMSDPKPVISPVSAVADATSAALMLIPSLTLKLFGVNTGSTGNTRPCEAQLGN